MYNINIVQIYIWPGVDRSGASAYFIHYQRKYKSFHLFKKRTIANKKPLKTLINSGLIQQSDYYVFQTFCDAILFKKTNYYLKLFQFVLCSHLVSNTRNETPQLNPLWIPFDSIKMIYYNFSYNAESVKSVY